MSKILVKYKAEFLGFSIGATAGGIHWYFIGCSSGTCTIASSALNSTLYGAVLGILSLSIIKPNKLKNK